MAAVAPYQSVTRQPFASLDGARLRNLTNIKNSQNALPVTLSSPVKRRHSPSFGEVDSENIDPSNFKSKKAKNLDGYPIKTGKASHFTLKSDNSSFASVSRPILTPKRVETARSTRKPAAPSSAPPAAGRSPKSKRVGILSRRRVSSSPFTRVDPPSFGVSNGLPFSIDAALSGTVASYKPEPVQNVQVSTLEESVPNTWMFDIHEDTIDEELRNLMEFSTQTLDISDDESRLAAKDNRGKENIPPADFSSMANVQTVGANRPVSRKDMMTDEPRTPLGDLDSSEFYAEGCDASSYIIVPAEKSSLSNEKSYDALGAKDIDTSAVLAKAATPERSQNDWNTLLAMVNASTKAQGLDAIAAADQQEDALAPIEIWESESAKGEDDTVVEGTMMSPLEDGTTGSDVAGAVDATSTY
ncbi:hypothetical protein MMC30_002818 [Trapelia coarctata]|nr:hypothetical protein [Trapelia coarctata]